MRVSEHCYAVTGLGYCAPWSVNAGFVTGGHTTLLVDAGANALAAATVHGYACAARPENHLIAVNTERHFDHIGGNGYYRERGIDIYGHPAVVRTPEEFRAEIIGFAAGISDSDRKERGEEQVFYQGTYLTNPNLPVEEDMRFDLGDLLALALLTPGHTPSNLSIYAPDDGVLFCGDALVSGYAPNLQGGGPAEWRQWLKSIDRIEEMSPRVVVPGHGAVARGDGVFRLIDSVRGCLLKALDTRAEAV
jgi:glyoxylase-like metal-dependent hydrolase (beta-lactamase superfamily II)